MTWKRKEVRVTGKWRAQYPSGWQRFNCKKKLLDSRTLSIPSYSIGCLTSSNVGRLRSFTLRYPLRSCSVLFGPSSLPCSCSLALATPLILPSSPPSTPLSLSHLPHPCSPPPCLDDPRRQCRPPGGHLEPRLSCAANGQRKDTLERARGR